MQLFMRGASTLPADIEPTTIIEGAVQAAFLTIAAGLGAAGYPVTGDFDPGEHQQIRDAFRVFFDAMALNNPTIAALNDD
jgi:hypothetical protein